MLTEARHQRILDCLAQKNVVTISEFTTLLNISDSTIRRDLQTLEDQGLLTRVHGGAKRRTQLNFEAPFQEKQQSQHDEKQLIGKHAASLLNADDVIYLDAGSTTFAMIPFIPQQLNIKVVTNSVHHAAMLAERQIETIILGGAIKMTTHAILGTTAYKQLQQFCFNKAFLGMNGIDLRNGFTTPDPEEANLKTLAIQQSQQAFTLVDRSKFAEMSFAHVAPLESCTIICNTCPQEFITNVSTNITVLEGK